MKSKKVSTWGEFAQCSAIGVDVCKKHLDIAGLCGSISMYRRISNTAKAIGELTEALVQQSFTGTVLCEATSHYHLVLAVMFCEAGLDIRVINPLLSSKHGKSAIRKTKTDRVDAQVLATMVSNEPNLPPPLQLTRSHCLVRHTLGLIHSQEQHLQGLKRSLDSYKERLSQLNLETGNAYQEAVEATKRLQRSHDHMLSELESYLLETQPDRQETIKRVSGIPGITRRNAALFIFMLNPTVSSAKSWIAYCGLDVAIKESGTWRGHGKITKRGPAWLRKRLYQAAWGTAMTDDQGRLYYDALKAKGRKHKEALVIMAKKLLGIMHALIVQQKTFDYSKAFQVTC